ncbi:MAG TPA: 2TM domain-containing protein [Flavobacterium sp.]|jgi:hypothetical protein
MEYTINHEAAAYEAARKKAKSIRSFYFNLMCYCIVIPILAVVNLVYTPWIYWFIFSALGWGIGITVHGFNAFGYSPLYGRAWEEKKLKQWMEKEKQKQH